MADLKIRLAQYAALSAAIPAAAATGAVVSNPSLDLVILPGQAAFIDFGPGFGEVFRFELRTHDSSSDPHRAASASYYNAFFQFNPDNGNVGSAGFVGTGISSDYNDPQRLANGAAIDTGRGFYDPMSASLSTQHDIANQYFTSFGTARASVTGYGDWFPSSRGYIGFKMYKDGSFHFGWFDVETLNWGGDARRNNTGLPELIIHGWGFNDEPLAGIDAGEAPTPAAGGLLALALGAAGLRRARRQVA